MNIIYFADIHGPKVIEDRGIRRNYSAAGTTKVISIAEGLVQIGYRVKIFSLGSPAERSGRIYNTLKEAIEVIEGKVIEICYAPAIDNRLLRGIFSFVATSYLFPRLIRCDKPNILIIYNLTLLSLLVALYSKYLGCRVILQYEDSATALREKKATRLSAFFRLYEATANSFIHGVVAPNPMLLSRFTVNNKCLVPGIVSNDLISSQNSNPMQKAELHFPLKLIYAGGLDNSKGVLNLVKAIFMSQLDCQLVVCGQGHLADDIKELVKKCGNKVVFRGFVSRAELIRLLVNSDIGINPHNPCLHGGGTWPFKVVEYLATCGAVMSSDVEGMPDELRARIFVYHGDTIDDIKNALDRLNKESRLLASRAEDNIEWVKSKYDSKSVASAISRQFI